MKKTEPVNGYYLIKPEIDGADESDSLKISLPALERIEQLIEEKDVPEHFYVRLGLRGGGTEGTKFFLEFENIVNENDKIFDVKNIQVLIDSRSLFFLLGFTIEYQHSGDSGEAGFILTGWKKTQSIEQ